MCVGPCWYYMHCERKLTRACVSLFSTLVFYSLPASFSSSVSRDLMTNFYYFFFNVNFLVSLSRDTLDHVYTRLQTPKRPDATCQLACLVAARFFFYDLTIQLRWILTHKSSGFTTPPSDRTNAPYGEAASGHVKQDRSEKEQHCIWSHPTWERTLQKAISLLLD